jgi:transcriptional regulator with XRE-family HTH domain
MSSQPLVARFALRLRQLREGRGLSQEALATAAGLHRTHVSLIERGRRVVRLETVERLATALRVDVAELFRDPEGLETSIVSENQDDVAEIRSLYPAIRRFQTIASRNGIDDIFQDNGGKLLQVLLVLGLQKLPGREGNDAIDAEGREYELKSVNVRLTRSFSTHHHLNPVILRKYRAVTAWFFAVYEHIELKSVYRLTPAQLETYFTPWEVRWQETQRDINNPKIPLRFVEEHGQLVYRFDGAHG